MERPRRYLSLRVIILGLPLPSTPMTHILISVTWS